MINYKKELEGAAKTMILVHKPDVLIRMIVRMIVRKVRVEHAGILLYDHQRDTYILTVSGGKSGSRIPKGFARMDADNPLIKFFRDRSDKKLFNEGMIVYDQAKKTLKRKDLSEESRHLLNGIIYQMEIFGIAACVASYHRDDLLGILMLGHKINRRRFGRDELEFFAALGHDVAMAIKNAQLFKELETQLKQKQQLFINTTVALAAAIDAKDHYTHGHTERVTNLSLAIARKLAEINKKEFNEGFLEHLHIASLLHDIGKIGIPESILNKEGALNEEEKKQIMDHPDIGAVILNPIKELEECIQGVKYHHENYDGSGYPEGLKAEQIPLVASIISVADTFDAMTTDRPYRKGLSKEEAIKEIARVSGKQLNPEICDIFTQLYKEGKV